MADPWIPLLTNLPLSRTEREVVKRFESDPAGRAFLPVADILRSHRLIDESLELLTEGVERHPSFTVARVVLARELLQKGMVGEAWRILEDAPTPLNDNLLAQKLRFRLALLLNYEPIVRATYQHLKLNQMLDAELKRLGELLEVSGIESAREKLLADLESRGVQPILPEPEAAAPLAAAAGDVASEHGLATPGGPSISVYFREDQLDPEEAQRLSAFHVVPLAEIFRPGDLSGAARAEGKGGIELDSTTLADIYERQGHYGKSLEVYRRLLRMTPGNDLLRRKVAELSKLDREQRHVDLTIDPMLVDRMETVDIIDRQIRFYNDLLGRLS